MTYDPKAKRPVADDPADDPAPVDRLLGAAPAVAADSVDGWTDGAPTPPRRLAPQPPLPVPVPTRRTPKAIAGALIAVAVVLLGWRRYRR